MSEYASQCIGMHVVNALISARMSACLQLRDPGIARVRRWCPQRVSRACRGWVGVECDVCLRQLTAVECRPPLALVRWQRGWARFPAALAPLHPGPPGTGCCAGGTVTCA